MPLLFQYVLKLSVSLAVVWLFYRVFLRQITFYNCNRWYLNGCSLLSLFIAAINITPVLSRTNVDGLPFVASIPAIRIYNATATPTLHPNAGSSVPVYSWIMLAIVMGMAVLLLITVVRYCSFLVLRRRATLLENGDIKLYGVDADIIPFSFGKSIYINAQKHTSEELKEIIRHEMVHVRQHHTADILFSQLLCIINWYNPFAWLIRSAIRQNLEFITDREVLQSGADKKDYQKLLLKILGLKQFTLSNQFNFSSLKKRMIMMNKHYSHKAHLLRFLIFVPLLAALLLAFRNPAIAVTSKKKNNYPVAISPAHDSQKTNGNISNKPASEESEKGKRKKDAVDDFFMVSSSSTKQDVEKLKDILIKAGYTLEIKEEKYNDGKLLAFSGTLGGEPLKNDLTTSVDFNIVNPVTSQFGCSPSTGRLKTYVITTYTHTSVTNN